MKFSIVTPSFNQGRYIDDCLASVREQEGVDVEHIVIDGGSTDETVERLKKQSFASWVSEPDKGQTDAINKGFRRATGDWLMWLNADDYLLPGALAQIRALIQRNPEARVAYGDYYFVTEDKRVIRYKREHVFDFNVLLFYGCYIPSTACFYHRSIIDSGHFLDDSYRVCMDFEYYVRLAREGFPFRYLNAPLASFRWHDSNCSAVHAQRRYQERLRVQREHLALSGRQWLGGERTLQFLFHAYQLKRAALKLSSRLTKAPPCPVGGFEEQLARG